MKRLIYLAFLAFSASALLSCEQEQITPAKAENLPANARANACQVYSYQSKSGHIQLGTAATDEILVVFNNSLTLAQKQQILRKFNKFDYINGEFATSIDNFVTFVMLKPNTTCADVEAMMQALNDNPNVLMVLPTFGSFADFTKKEFYNGILVTMKNPNSSVAIRRLVQLTNTRIAAYPDELGPGTYYILVDKQATGNFFHILTVFNSSDKVALADPDGTFMLPAERKARAQVAFNKNLAKYNNNKVNL